MPNFNVGDKIFHVGSLKDPDSFRDYTVTQVKKDTVQCGSKENTFYSAFCFPIRVKAELLAIVTETARQQKLVDDRMKLVFELINQIQRGEK